MNTRCSPLALCRSALAILVATSMLLIAYPAVACFRPALGAELDRLIKIAGSAERSALLVQRAHLNELSTRPEEARIEEEAIMRSLGYEKVWLRCGAGSFMWAPKRR